MNTFLGAFWLSARPRIIAVFSTYAMLYTGCMLELLQALLVGLIGLSQVDDASVTCYAKRVDKDHITVACGFIHDGKDVVNAVQSNPIEVKDPMPVKELVSAWCQGIEAASKPVASETSI